jgi:DNA-binding NtrC family response regulator
MQSHISILLIEDNHNFVRLVNLYLQKQETIKFEIVAKENGSDALKWLEEGHSADVILMDYFLPGHNGLEITRILHDKGYTIPVIFLTVNKDITLAIEAMKLGIEGYLIKEEISTPVLPRTIASVLEKVRLRRRLSELEISQKRLEAVQEMVVSLSQELNNPITAMKLNVDSLLQRDSTKDMRSYLVIIRDNLERMEKKIERLKELKEDKTVVYIKDLRMFDISS